jgi:hypothetical protein
MRHLFLVVITFVLFTSNAFGMKKILTCTYDEPALLKGESVNILIDEDASEVVHFYRRHSEPPTETGVRMKIFRSDDDWLYANGPRGVYIISKKSGKFGYSHATVLEGRIIGGFTNGVCFQKAF